MQPIDLVKLIPTEDKPQRHDFLSNGGKKKPYKAANELIIAGHTISTPGGQELTKISGSDKTFTVDIFLFRLIEPKDHNKPPYIKQDGISVEHYKQLLEGLGYYSRKEESGNFIFVHDKENILQQVSINEMKKDVYEKYVNKANAISIKLDDTTWNFSKTELVNVYHNYQRGLFSESFFVHLKEHTRPILRDTEANSYLFFRNYIIKTGKGVCDDLELLEYADNTTHCIWKDHIIEHDFQWNDDFDNSHFAKFIRNVSAQAQDRINAMQTAIGYLLHSYNKPSGGQVVIAYDEQPAKKGEPAGGTGKGIYINGIKRIRNVAKIDGKKYRTDDKFKWQAVKKTSHVVWLDDVKEKFPFEDLHSNSTDGWNIEYKHMGEVFVPPSESPKIFIASNTVLATEGTTNKRRQFIIEFGNHYSQRIINGTEEPVKDEHGCMFFSADWDQDEWDRFYSYMIYCQVMYFADGLKSYEHVNLKTNQLLKLTNEDFQDYCSKIEFETQYTTKVLFDEFRQIYGYDDDFKQRTFSSWIKTYASVHGKKARFWRTNGENVLIIE